MNPAKVKTVERLKQVLDDNPNLLVINYTGHNVTAMGNLRRELRQRGLNVLVARNTLMAVAAEQSGREMLKELLGGQIAFVLAGDSDDVAQFAKGYSEGVKASKVEDLKLVGGLAAADLLSADNVKALAKLPPREVLLAQLLGGMNGPIQGLVSVAGALIAALPRTLAAVAEAKQNQPDQAVGAAKPSEAADAGEASEVSEAPKETPASEAPSEATEEPPASEAPSEATEETPASEAPSETTEETPASEAPSEATEETSASEAPSEATEETPASEAPSEATEEPPASDAPSETTEETQTNEATEENQANEAN